MTAISNELLALRHQAEQLEPEEQLQLIAYLAEQLRQKQLSPIRRKWREIRGTAPYPLVGEDAQDWVTRNRQESDDSRERAWSHET